MKPTLKQTILDITKKNHLIEFLYLVTCKV